MLGGKEDILRRYHIRTIKVLGGKIGGRKGLEVKRGKIGELINKLKNRENHRLSCG